MDPCPESPAPMPASRLEPDTVASSVDSGSVVDFEIHRILRREFGLCSEDIRALDLALAVEWGLLPAPRVRPALERALLEQGGEAPLQR